MTYVSKIEAHPTNTQDAAYPPGTVAVATVRGVKGVRVMSYAYEDGVGGWASSTEAGGEMDHADHVVTDVRPLMVLDLDGIAPEAIVKALRNADGGTNSTGWARVADQIEAQAKPPRIPEPTTPLAEVMADDSVGRGRRRFVRGYEGPHGAPARWVDGVFSWKWDDLINPTLIREGINA